MAIALFDTLIVRARPGPFELTCDDHSCPTDDTNLVSRAAAAVWKAAGRRGTPHGVAVHLVKRIPIQAGLGGGSSDAAAALRVFARRWRVPMRRLGRVARRLGADVPYFLVGGTAVGESRGDRLRRIGDPRRYPLVIVVPRVRVSTKEAFGWWDRERSSGAGRPAPSGDRADRRGTASAGRVACGDVGQRFGGIWTVQEPRSG
jgi:4-diphosphocytidyl-2-C-methyl-D-erythritol kinase